MMEKNVEEEVGGEGGEKYHPFLGGRRRKKRERRGRRRRRRKRRKGEGRRGRGRREKKEGEGVRRRKRRWEVKEKKNSLVPRSSHPAQQSRALILSII